MLQNQYGIKTFPTFGSTAVDGGKTSAIDTTNAAFNTLVSTLKTVPVVEGNEIYAQQAWMKIQEANALLLLAYGGKSIANGH
jgi:uncharacterized protein YecT (DUF1311 family)